MRTLRAMILGAMAGVVAHGILLALPQSTMTLSSPLLIPLIVALLLAPCVFARRWIASLSYFAALLPVWV